MTEAPTHAYRADAYENDRAEVRALVPSGASRILDLGCSSGVLGAALKASHNATVVGVEIDPEYASRAAQRLDTVITSDLQRLFDDPTAVAALGRFDCLIAADVLEHLVDPWTVLSRAAALLDSGGVAVVSLPNIRFWQTFWEIGWKGEWPRHSSGIYDRTHLQYFTAGDAQALVQQAGLEFAALSRVYRLSSRWPTRHDRYARMLGHTPLRPFFAFQNIVLARKP